MTIETDFHHQALFHRLRRQPEWTDGGLEVGCGTRLLSLKAVGGEDRMLTILSIASECPVDSGVLKHIEAARAHWMADDKALAHIHLAFAKMPILDEAGAYRAFLADRLIASGMTPSALRQALGLTDAPAAQKYDSAQPRVPAGSGPTSGQWAPDDGAPVREGRSTASSDAHVEAVLYDDRRGDADDRAREKQHDVLGDRTLEDASRHGRPLPFLPDTAPIIPFPFIAPGTTGGDEGPPSDGKPRDDRSRLCPAPTPDWGVNDREFSARYQEYVGMVANPTLVPPVPATQAYRFFNPESGRDVRVDHCRLSDGALIEAKALYAWGLGWRDENMEEEFVKQARRQVEAARANGNRAVEWWFHEEEMERFARRIFDKNDDLKNIVTGYIPLTTLH